MKSVEKTQRQRIISYTNKNEANKEERYLAILDRSLSYSDILIITKNQEMFHSV